MNEQTSTTSPLETLIEDAQTLALALQEQAKNTALGSPPNSQYADQIFAQSNDASQVAIKLRTAEYNSVTVEIGDQIKIATQALKDLQSTANFVGTLNKLAGALQTALTVAQKIITKT